MKTYPAFVGRDDTHELKSGTFPVLERIRAPREVAVLLNSESVVQETITKSTFLAPEFIMQVLVPERATEAYIMTALKESEDELLANVPPEFTDMRITTRGPWEPMRTRDSLKIMFSLCVSLIAFQKEPA